MLNTHRVRDPQVGSALDQLPAAVRAAVFGEARMKYAGPFSRVDDAMLVFPVGGIIAVRDAASRIEVGSVGREGGICLRIEPPFEAVTLTQCNYLEISALTFAHLALDHRALAALGRQCNDWLLTQTRQIAVCGAGHGAAQRIARYLLRSFDLWGDDAPLPFRQSDIAVALGLHRGVVLARMADLRDAVAWRHGQISLKSRERLRARACDCCEAFGRERWPQLAGEKDAA